MSPDSPPVLLLWFRPTFSTWWLPADLSRRACAQSELSLDKHGATASHCTRIRDEGVFGARPAAADETYYKSSIGCTSDIQAIMQMISGALALATLLTTAAASPLQCRSSDYSPPPLSSSDHQSCPANSPLSCSSGTDSCCLEATNGLFLQTQFWDYSPATGPSDSWTIHGLWSDKCAGGFQQFCNPSWEITDVTSTLQGLGDTALLDTMQTYWKNQGSSDESLWEHEFNKHGTCMATVNPACYDSSAPQYQYVGDFFNSVVSLWKTLPSYTWLTQAGITPSTSATYNVADFKAALTGNFNGKDVYLGCDSKNAITEIWYFFNLKGSVAAGTFIPTDSVSSSTCKDGFQWLPKGSSSGGGGGGGGGGGTTQKGSLNIGGQNGCLISDGSWFTSGTCATFTITNTIGGVSVTSSKGACNVVNGKFTCGSGVTAGDFTLSGAELAYGGETGWSASQVASGQTKVPVYTGSGGVNFNINFASSS